jgi:hypothetical protein
MRRILLVVVLTVILSAITVSLASAQQFEGDKGEARLLPPEVCENSGATATDVIFGELETPPFPGAPRQCLLVTPEFIRAK